MHLCGTENGEIFVMSFLQPRQTRKISYREQQELLRIALEEHPEFNKQGMILDTIEKGGKEINSNALPREILWIILCIVHSHHNPILTKEPPLKIRIFWKGHKIWEHLPQKEKLNWQSYSTFVESCYSNRVLKRTGFQVSRNVEQLCQFRFFFFAKLSMIDSCEKVWIY